VTIPLLNGDLPILYLQECIKKHKCDWIVFTDYQGLCGRRYNYYSIDGIIYKFYDYFIVGKELTRLPFGKRKVEVEISKCELFKYKLKYKWWKIWGHTWARHSYNALKYNDDVRRCIENENY
jgi:hypothetical protein